MDRFLETDGLASTFVYRILIVFISNGLCCSQTYLGEVYKPQFLHLSSKPSLCLGTLLQINESLSSPMLHGHVVFSLCPATSEQATHLAKHFALVLRRVRPCVTIRRGRQVQGPLLYLAPNRRNWSSGPLFLRHPDPRSRALNSDTGGHQRVCMRCTAKLKLGAFESLDSTEVLALALFVKGWFHQRPVSCRSARDELTMIGREMGRSRSSPVLETETETNFGHD